MAVVICRSSRDQLLIPITYGRMRLPVFVRCIVGALPPWQFIWRESVFRQAGRIRIVAVVQCTLLEVRNECVPRRDHAFGRCARCRGLALAGRDNEDQSGCQRQAPQILRVSLTFSFSPMCGGWASRKPRERRNMVWRQDRLGSTTTSALSKQGSISAPTAIYSQIWLSHPLHTPFRACSPDHLTSRPTARWNSNDRIMSSYI